MYAKSYYNLLQAGLHGSGLFLVNINSDLAGLHAVLQPSMYAVLFAAGWAARFGSGLFLIIQMIILLDFTQSWNDAWVANGEQDERWLYGLLALTVTCFAGVLGISGETLEAILSLAFGASSVLCCWLISPHRDCWLCMLLQHLPFAIPSLRL
jgi:hypothetical protein